jgi:hypothetical protein
MTGVDGEQRCASAWGKAGWWSRSERAARDGAGWSVRLRARAAVPVSRRLATAPLRPEGRQTKRREEDEGGHGRDCCYSRALESSAIMAQSPKPAPPGGRLAGRPVLLVAGRPEGRHLLRLAHELVLGANLGLRGCEQRLQLSTADLSLLGCGLLGG